MMTKCLPWELVQPCGPRPGPWTPGALCPCSSEAIGDLAHCLGTPSLRL